MTEFKDEDYVDPALLQFDLQNPRAGSDTFADEGEAISHLIASADIDEIVSSVLSAGWIDYEPLIVERGSNTVLEGNRRLAALRMIGNTAARQKAEYRLPAVSDPKPLPEKVRVRWVSNRQEARSFIAFKHINGPAKWDAFAKARYAKDWLDEGASIADVSKAVGDNHNTVLRLVNGLIVLDQAVAEGFDKSDITAAKFNFSHLYTALTRPSVRKYVGLTDEVSAILPKDPVPKAQIGELQTVMGWLYGQSRQGREHVIRSQNPDLNQFVKVLTEPRAIAVLEKTKTLRLAFEEVEPPSFRFEEALKDTALSAERTLGLMSHFDAGTQGLLLETVQKLATSVRILRDEMRSKMQPDDDL
uniref:hypothetical protein n=1 Tax=uncultured Caulobacter sp. TaxID=158749 RepID=UPI0025D2F320|nr:hypothetical protein [uncultured Caulobacter sp.]